jgi:hypothetical protein
LGKFLLRQGRRPPTGMTSWTQWHLAWIKTTVHFEQPAQARHALAHAPGNEVMAKRRPQIFTPAITVKDEPDRGSAAA